MRRRKAQQKRKRHSLKKCPACGREWMRSAVVEDDAQGRSYVVRYECYKQMPYLVRYSDGTKRLHTPNPIGCGHVLVLR